ncbi:MAG: PTS sugar transporter subunit IIB, partial [Tissierellaceae bacterium]|nr:PTS sugar transporter subunit IIB [Tissierellaceae bacterium]
MANIVLTRIDDRLIHGQVMTAWVKQTKATRIIIIDDVVAKDDFMKKVLTMAAPPGI